MGDDVRLIAPAREPAPLVYDSPHSGTRYPPEFRAGSPAAALRRGEDAHVAALISDAARLGVPVLCAAWARCWIDVNRAEDDLDADMLAEPWPDTLAPTEKSKLGLGLVRRFVVPGVPVNAGPLTAADVRNRIARGYRPYHAALDRLVHETRQRHGFVWLVDWHSMKSVGNDMTPDGPGAQRPDFVLGDRDGAACAPELTGLVAGILEGMGYDVAVDDPYRGGEILRRLGDPARGVHALQIEINRALYMDEDSVEPDDGFDVLRRDLRLLTEQLVAEARAAAARAPSTRD